MLKPFLIFWALVFFAFSASAQQRQTLPKAEPSAQYTIPSEAVRKINPVKPTAESIAGARSYMAMIAPCAMAKMAVARVRKPRT